MVKVKDLIKEKGFKVFAVPGTMTLAEAVSTMNEKHIGALMVVHEDKSLGIFTERDVVKQVAAGVDFATTKVEDADIKDLFVAHIDDDLEHAMSIMIQKNVRHLPIVEEGKLTGFLSMRDVAKVQVKSLEREVRHMKDYITGSGAGDALSDMWY